MTREPEVPPPSDAETQDHPARKWIVTTVLLLVVVVGIGVYAFSLRSDVDDKDAQIATQQKQIADQKGVASDVQDAAASLADNVKQAFGQLGDQIDEIEGDAAASQEETQQAIEDADKAAADAKASADSASDEVDKANARADEAEAQAETAGACARGYLTAIGNAFDAESVSDGVNQAMSEMKALSGSCRESLGS